MKRFRIVLVQEVHVPDDAEIVLHPTDDFECVELNHKYYLPTVSWLERTEDTDAILDVPSGEPAGPGWFLSDDADEIFSNIVAEDAIVHEQKGSIPRD